MTSSWRWAGACSIGTSHIENGTECQDRACCRLVPGTDVVVAVVSDGAGSASHSGRGAYIVCAEFSRQVTQQLRSGGALTEIDQDQVADWLDVVRERISVAASAAGVKRREFASTLVAVLASAAHTVVVHVGDGAAVVRYADTKEWEAPSWPAHGQFVNQTNFVVDDPQPTLEVVHVEREIDRFALFSDGLEYHVLDFRQRTVPSYYFEEMTAPVADATGSGRLRKLSAPLRSYLDGEKITAVTDDDKSLILAAR